MRPSYARTAALILGLLALAGVRPQAQTPAAGGAAPFDIVGFIDAATVEPQADRFSGGGTITVNGTKIIVPQNTLLQMPAFALTWQEVFAMAPAPWGPPKTHPLEVPQVDASAQSGLAKADTPSPATTYEVRVQGNRLKGADGEEQYIAGLMFIAQQSLNAGAGFINYIDYAAGELRVGGEIGNASTGARVVINDPIGKFGRARTHDARFTIDEDNPTVRSETAFPMCVPRFDPASQDDPDCPQANRPRQGGNYLTVFTMDAPICDADGCPREPNPGEICPESGRACTNPVRMAPFEVGDYVTYSGALVTAGENDEYVSAHSVIANVGLFTAPGTQPTYTAIDVTLLGVGGVPDPFLPQEATVRSKLEGFTTDPTSLGVDLYAIDVDACTGQQSWRYYASASVDQGGVLGAVAGRWRWTPNSDVPLLPPTRNMLAVSWNGLYTDWNTGGTRTASGIEAGQYLAPNFEFIFPENLGIGNPPVPSNFQDFPFLASGSGPYAGAVPEDDPETGSPIVRGRLGQLSPWPGAITPVTPVCTDAGAVFAPVADAGPPQSVKTNEVVTLDASGSRETNPNLGLTLQYYWKLVDGPVDPLTRKTIPVKIASLPGQPALRTFTTPEFFDAQRQRRIALPYTLTFEVTVNNGYVSSVATVKIDVTDRPVPADVITISTATFRPIRERLDVNATSSDPAAVLTLQGFGDMGPGVPATGGGASISIVGVYPQPLTVTVISSKGGTATIPVTVR